MNVVEVNHLSKTFKSYRKPWLRLIEWLVPKKIQLHESINILEDISFSVKKGESLGIVGMNGSGKSTLLKMITGISLPTKGSIHINGSIAAILELGIGFQPELSGQQNIFIIGELLGYSDSEIKRLLPHIEAFAEIGEYIHKPIRTYSSGMQMRLAFSIVTAKRPDILIIDEALSVGDAYFQHKSMDRIRQFQKQGTSLLFVSHDKNAILSMCDKAILINNHRIVCEGTPEYVMNYYDNTLEKWTQFLARLDLKESIDAHQVMGTGEAQIKNVRLINKKNETSEVIFIGDYIRLEIDVKIHACIDRLGLGFIIKDKLGLPIYGINTQSFNKVELNLLPGELVTVSFEFHANISAGHYSISIALAPYLPFVPTLDTNYELRHHALIFHVLNNNKVDFVGTTWLAAKPSFHRHALLEEMV